MTYVVTVYNLAEHIKDEFEYTRLTDAIRVAESTTNNSELFERDLILLLTTGNMYFGKKSAIHPRGDSLIQLAKRDSHTSHAYPVYGPDIVPFVMGAETPTYPPVAKLPSQNSDKKSNTQHMLIGSIRAVIEETGD